MAQGELWATLLTAINPINASAMPVVLQSTIDLLEAELVKARAALQQVQAEPTVPVAENVTAGAMEAYKVHLVGCASRKQSNHSFLPLIDDSFVRYSSMTARKPSRNCTALADILSNSLVIDHLAPYMSVASLLSLASTNRTMRSLVMDTPYVFRHLDLTQSRGAQVPLISPIDRGGTVWRNERIDESLTEDEFYSGPLRGIFDDLGRRAILQDVRTLILDGLSVPADLVAEIVLNDRFNVSILSIRGCLNLNERKLMQTLQYAVRPGRAKGTPRLKGIYHFSPKDSDQPSCHQTTLGKRRRPDLAQTGHHTNHAYHPHHSEKDVQHRHEWYKPSGQVLKGTITNGWAQTLQLCERIISFDAVLCRSPRHDPNSFTGENSKRIGSYLQPAIATVALGPRGCEGCGTAPEGPAVWGYSPEEYFPLLAPPPLHSSRIAVAKNPAVYKNESPTLIMQCEDCVRNRLCRRCNRWWCSDCLQDPEILRTPGTAYQPPGMFAGMEQSKECEFLKHPRQCVARDCWECGPTCTRCMIEVIRTCEICQGGFCLDHNDGCSQTKCDWCNTPRRGGRV
ncbi:uncharacterized protein CIMG_08531 [Coccidioides immitis RS]|uniref:F-box domain-containing protein n=2 Tax=Coccidioides immitis TaxID=5501 RepID=A0A0E1RVE1_COCIM|nr:uncharacterized protein CIMG_08531 [Coccidioides immitis RS]EAS29785.2 hypothetical protein CIMG_08531 [Coccidioides immitis RS]KMU91593.1 hypothetical protein CIHG_09448 [Coccidioides immitis H538.4]